MPGGLTTLTTYIKSIDLAVIGRCYQDRKQSLWESHHLSLTSTFAPQMIGRVETSEQHGEFVRPDGTHFTARASRKLVTPTVMFGVSRLEVRCGDAGEQRRDKTGFEVQERLLLRTLELVFSSDGDRTIPNGKEKNWNVTDCKVPRHIGLTYPKPSIPTRAYHFVVLAMNITSRVTHD